MTFLLHLLCLLGSLISQMCRCQSQYFLLPKALKLQLFQHFYLLFLKTMARLAGQCKTWGKLHKTNSSGQITLKLMLGREFLWRRHLGEQKKQWTSRKGFWPSSLCEMQPLTTLPSASPSNRSILLIKSMQPPTTIHPAKAIFLMHLLVRKGRSLTLVRLFFY